SGDGGRPYGGERRFDDDRRAGGDRPRWQGNDRGPDRRDGEYRGRDDSYARGGDRRPAGPRSGGPRPGRSQGSSRAVADRIGGASPAARSSRSPRQGGAGRRGSRGPSFGGGRSGRPSGYRDRPGDDRGRSYDRRDDRPRDDRSSGGSSAPRIPDSITDDPISREGRGEPGSPSLGPASTARPPPVPPEPAPRPGPAPPHPPRGT